MSRSGSPGSQPGRRYGFRVVAASAAGTATGRDGDVRHRGAPARRPRHGSLRCTIVGTNGPDRLVGTWRRDVICGLGGADMLIGLGRDDILVGGPGNDYLRPGGGRDRSSAAPGTTTSRRATALRTSSSAAPGATAGGSTAGATSASRSCGRLSAGRLAPEYHAGPWQWRPSSSSACGPAGSPSTIPTSPRSSAASSTGSADQIELIASENFTWPAILEAVGSVPTNKYAEGYPGRRYYGGCEIVDELEQLAIDRAKALFGAEHANVQPHAGAQANMAVYLGLLEPGDTVLSLRLDHGGHLTHGLKVNFSGRLYTIVHYGVSRETGVVDEEEVRALARRAPAEARPLRRVGVSRGRSTRPCSAASPTRSARCSGATWRTSPGSSPQGSTRTRSSTATSSPRRRTRRSPARARA